MRAGPLRRPLARRLCCPHGGCARFCRLSTRRATFQCNPCKRQISLLAGIIFQPTKLPLTTWFLAIYFLSQTKSGISALEPGRKLGVNDNTAWLLKHKLMQARQERDQRYRLEGTVQLTRRLSGQREPRRQARVGLGEQDAGSGGRAGHRRWPAGGDEAGRWWTAFALPKSSSGPRRTPSREPR